MLDLDENEQFDYYQEVARSGFADMLHDSERNQKYSMGIKLAIQTMKSRGRKANVLDIGTGTGLLAMLASQHGADSVITIEAFSPVSHIARKIIETNGFGDKIKIVNKHSTEVKIGEGKDMTQKANILVAEVLDTELIGEGAIKTYNHAHQHLMEIDCICVPDSASIFVQIVECPSVDMWNTFKSMSCDHNVAVKCPENIAKCSGAPSIHDIQLSQLQTDKFKTLGHPLKICEFDFSGKTVIPQSENYTKQFPVADTGRANAVFFWWDIKMNTSGSIMLSCAPHWSHPDTETLAKSNNEVVRRNAIPWRDHWMQGCYYLHSGTVLEKESYAFVTANHDEFSWWFNVSKDANVSMSINRPNCSCLFHMINSRNRIMQINSFDRNLPFIRIFKRESQENFLFVGDHCLLALLCASINDQSNVFSLEDNPLCVKSLTKFIDDNSLAKRVKLIKELKDLKGENITRVVAEPHFNCAVLPWDNISMFWRRINDLKKHQKQPFNVTPTSALIYAVPVHFLKLQKIRWPLKSTCEGFNHQLFDNVLEIASSLADENVEPFSLWEYPCIALGSAVNIFDLCMHDTSIKGFETNIEIKDFSRICNGIAFWVDWTVDEDSSISCGPSNNVEIGELIVWKLEERQGVHLIASGKIETDTINSITIKTRYTEDERLAMDFTYCYR